MAQKCVIEDLFNIIENYHGVEAWRAICRCISDSKGPGLSEYEIYFNFVFTRTNQVKLRQLKWLNTPELWRLSDFKKQGYEYFSCHSYMRNLIPTQQPSEEVFTHIYKDNIWGGYAGSGGGGLIKNAYVYVDFLKHFLKQNNIKTVVDIGCGDWGFSQHIDWKGINYIGYDVVKSVIERNQQQFGTPSITFKHGDALTIELPKADLLICKDVLQHLTNKDIVQFLTKLSKFKYCLLVNDILPGGTANEDISRGGHRPIDLSKSPFNADGKRVLEYQSDHNTKQVFLIQNH